jgi:EAL domain-containing protein (putative c-di-GMP-specific phosphodiesterase class I)
MSIDAARERPGASPAVTADTAASALCFIIDQDFGFRQEFARQLQGAGVEVIEYSSSARLADNVEEHNPDVVFVNISATDPCDGVRALIALKECNFSGRIQIMGKCERKFLDSMRNVGLHMSLHMLAGMEKPIEFSAVRKMVQDHGLSRYLASARELSLREAISRNWIQFWFQPKIDLRKKQVVGAEVLARLAHPQHGMVAPGKFLTGSSEEDRSILARQALISALKAGVSFEQRGFSLRFSINIGLEDLVTLPVADLIAKHRPQQAEWPGIILEIRERQAVNKLAVLKEKVQELRRHGVAFALDNCGRSNSSLTLLAQLPLVEMKIDASFTRGCSDNKGNASVCKAIIEMAHAFSIDVAGTGIEAPTDARALIGAGCDLAQGFLYGRPMAEQHLATMMMAGRDDSRSFVRTAAPVRPAAGN